MWLLISTVCVFNGPLTVECQREVSRPYVSEDECSELEIPTVEYLTDTAKSMEMPVLFIGSGCLFGLVG